MDIFRGLISKISKLDFLPVLFNIVTFLVFLAVIGMLIFIRRRSTKWRASNFELGIITALGSWITFFIYYKFFNSFSGIDVCVPFGFGEICIYPEDHTIMIGLLAMIAYVLVSTGVIPSGQEECQVFNEARTGEIYGEGIIFLPSPGILIKKFLYMIGLPLFYEKRNLID